MSVILGGINLGGEFVLRGLDSAPVQVDQQRTDEGLPVLLVGLVEGGRVLELNGELTQGIEDQVLALSAQGVAVELDHPRFVGSVIITGTEYDFILTEYVNPTGASLKDGSIFLIEV